MQDRAQLPASAPLQNGGDSGQLIDAADPCGHTHAAFWHSGATSEVPWQPPWQQVGIGLPGLQLPGSPTWNALPPQPMSSSVKKSARLTVRTGSPCRGQ